MAIRRMAGRDICVGNIDFGLEVDETVAHLCNGLHLLLVAILNSRSFQEACLAFSRFGGEMMMLSFIDLCCTSLQYLRSSTISS